MPSTSASPRLPPGGGGPLGAQRRYAALVLLGLAVVAAAAVLRRSGSSDFRPYFGSLDPVLATLIAAVVAVGSLAFLEEGGWFRVGGGAAGRARLVLPPAVATLLVIPVILVDTAGGFPEGMNVLLPRSLLFYPVMGFVVESLFHAAPLAVSLAALSPLVEGPRRETILWACIGLAALPEPAFQVLAGAGESPAWANAYVGFHLLVFNVAGLYFFKRWGFFTMYAFRLVYYLHWHIVWGTLRLHVLF